MNKVKNALHMISKVRVLSWIMMFDFLREIGYFHRNAKICMISTWKDLRCAFETMLIDNNVRKIWDLHKIAQICMGLEKIGYTFWSIEKYTIRCKSSIIAF